MGERQLTPYPKFSGVPFPNSEFHRAFLIALRITIVIIRVFCIICFWDFHRHPFWSHECFGWRSLTELLSDSRNCWITSISYFLSSFTVVNDSPDFRIKRFVHRLRQRIKFAHSSVVIGSIPLKKVGGIAVVIWVGQPQFKTALFLILNPLTIEPLWVSKLREVIISHHTCSNFIMSELSVTCRHDKMAFFLVTLLWLC